MKTRRLLLVIGLMATPLTSLPATFDEVQSQIFNPSCALSGCHADDQTPILLEGQSFSNIVNVQSTQELDYVEPGDPNRSYIVQKLEGTAPGPPMPFAQLALSTDKIQLVRDWITSGASSGQYLGRAYYMTTSTSPNLSQLSIINSSDSPQSFTGTLYAKSGLQLGEANVALHSGTIKSYGRLILLSSDLETLFNVPAWTGPAMLEVTSGNQFDLMSKLMRNGRVSNTNCVRSGNAQNLEGADSSDVSYIRFINQGDTTIADIRGTVYDENGDPIGQANVQFLDQLAPKEAIFLNQIAISNIIGMTWNGEAFLQLAENHENLRLMNLNFVNNETFFNFSCYESGMDESSNVGRAYYMTTSTSPNLSQLSIINSSDSPQSFTGTLYAKSGLQLGEADVALHSGTIKSYGRLILLSADLETIFNVPAWTGPAMLEVTSGKQFDLMSKLMRNGRVSNTNCVRSGNAQNIEGADSSDVSYIRFINQGDTTIADIRGTVYDENGDPIGQANVQFLDQLAPKEAIFLNQIAISNIIGMTWNGEAFLQLAENHDDLRLMNLNFVNNETFFNFSCYENGTDQGVAVGGNSEFEPPEIPGPPGLY